MNLTDAKVIVTGGTSGIGKATALALAEKGALVAAVSRDPERVQSVASLHPNIFGITGDVRDEQSVTSFFSEATKKLAGLNVVINNAAYGYLVPLIEIEVEAFQEMMQTNLVGAMMVARAAARHFVKESYGNLINISSTAGLNGFPGGSPYVASKFALRGMTECWRKELREHNIRTILINPSEVQTDFVTNSGRKERAFSERKLVAEDIARTIVAALELDDRALLTEATVWATNP